MTTTAAALLAYRKELLDGGISHNTVEDMVRDAARLTIGCEGLQANNTASDEPIGVAYRVPINGVEHRIAALYANGTLRVELQDYYGSALSSKTTCRTEHS